MTLLKRLSQVAVEIESVEGTAETLVAADATQLVYGPTYTPDIGRFNRDPARAYLSKLDAVIGNQMARIAWRTELKGSGVVGTEPAWSDALEACGFQKLAVSLITIGAVAGGPFTPGESLLGGTSAATGIVLGEIENGDAAVRMYSTTGTWESAETITGGTSGASATTSSTETTDQGFVYIPDSSSPASVTVALFQNGLKKMIHGARGNVRVACVGGEPAFLDFDFQGVYNAPTDTALLAPTYETTVPPAFLSVDLALLDYTAACFGSLDVDMSNTLTPRECASLAKGVSSVFITDRDPGGAIDPEMALVATHDFYGSLVAGTTGYLACELGSVAGNVIVIAAPRVQYANVGDGDRGGIAVASLDLEFKGSGINAGDDEIQLAMI